MFKFIVAIGCCFVMASCTSIKSSAYINARIYSGSHRYENADAFLIKDGRFQKIGTTEHIKQLVDDPGSVVDLNGALVFPGFIESHGHLLGLGKIKSMLDLRGLSASRIAGLVHEEAKKHPKNTWIKGRGWDQNLWDGHQFPNLSLLKAIEHPVYLTRVDGHAIWVNEAALRIAGIAHDQKDPPGGQILRGPSGKPTGVFIDTAMELINRHLPLPTKQELAHYLNVGMQNAISFGITSFHDAGSPKEVLELFQEYAKNNKLLLRLYAMIDGQDQKLVDHYLERGPLFINDLLTIRSIKYFADGALGSRGALLLKDYSDLPGHRGLALIEKDTLLDSTQKALLKGFQVATHAIGDGANRMVLDVYEKALLFTSVKNARLRIEHAQLIDESDHHRFKKLGVIASMQPIHCTADMGWVENRLSSKRLKKRAYPWRSLRNQGAVLAFGSDTPVEDINPILGLHAAFRRSAPLIPENTFMPEEKLTLEEALEGYFSQAAFAEFNEHQKGQIKEGYLADFVVFQDDILHPQESSFIEARPIMTVVGGKLVFEQNNKKIKNYQWNKTGTLTGQ